MSTVLLHTYRRVLMAEVSGEPERGVPRVGWIDGAKVAFGSRG